MKKRLLTLLLFVLSTTPIFSQGIDIGIKGGVNLSKLTHLPAVYNSGGITYNYYNDQDPSAIFFGINAGVFARFTIIKSFYVQTEFIYSQKSNKVNVDFYPIGVFSNSTRLSNSFTVNYIDVPLLFGYSTKNGRFRVNAGPMVSFAVQSNQSILNVRTGIRAASTSITGLSSTVFGYQAGIGSDIGRFSIDLKYESYFNDVTSTNDPSYRLNSLQLSVGFMIVRLNRE